MSGDSRAKESSPANDGRGRPIDWKLLFNQLFAREIHKEHILSEAGVGSDVSLESLLQAYTAYTPSTFNDALEEISRARTADEAYEARQTFFGNPRHRRAATRLDLDRAVGPEVREFPGAGDFLACLEEHQERPIEKGENFFESPEGRIVREAFRDGVGGAAQDVALVLVPGYGAHTIKYAIFEEIVRDANEFHHRPSDRPLRREEGIDLEFEGHRTFYARGRRRGEFDILHPAGAELGNTAGPNVDSTDALYQWIKTLPESYDQTKFIFLGYSKGAPVVLDLVNRHPDLSERILGYVTYAGVIQGTQVARQVLDLAQDVLRDVPVSEFIDRVRQRDPAMLGRVLSPLFADVDMSWLSLPRIRAILDILSIDCTRLEEQVDRVLGGREVRELLDGAKDLSPLERIRWSLLRLNDQTFRHDSFIFNLSAVADLKDFVRPVGLRLREGPSSLLAPFFESDGQLDWTQLSLDALFLFVTSREGFKCAPAGLFDTQVELPNTKTLVLDRRPLSESLTDGEIQSLWDDSALRGLLERYDVMSKHELARRPRCDLIPHEARRRLDSIDLGEFRGHHWSLFVQALRPPPEVSREHAVWDFPRKAFIRAVLQVVAFHNLVRRGSPPSIRSLPEAPKPEGVQPYRDVVFFRTYGAEAPQEHLRNLGNLAARAATYGVVATSARTAPGTAPPMGEQLASESLYYRALRLYSYFDLAFGRGLLHDEKVWPLPQSLAAVVGHFPASFADTYPDEPYEKWSKASRILKLLGPRMPSFELRRLGPGEYGMDPGSRQVFFSQAIQDHLWRGTEAKLASIERHAYRPDGAEVSTKLEAMLGAFTPLSTVIAAVFDEKTPEQSYTRVTTYLPPYHTLHADDLDFPATWHLEKGLKDFDLSRPIQISSAEITGLRYLENGDPSRNQAIKLEFHRDFEERDQVTSIASFGHLFSSSPSELCGFDASDPAEALYVIFRPCLSLDDGESPADRAAKEAYNLMFGGFEVEARIHQLTLSLRRDSFDASRVHGDDALLRPRFSLSRSKISFRVHRNVDTTVERLPLMAAGFNCTEGTGRHRFHCWRDFWTWDHLRDEFFSGRSLGANKPKLPEHLRERLLEQLVGSATRVIIDRSIGSIEDAIDGEIGRIAENYLKRYAKARDVLTERLHAGLF